MFKMGNSELTTQQQQQQQQQQHSSAQWGGKVFMIEVQLLNIESVEAWDWAGILY